MFCVTDEKLSCPYIRQGESRVKKTHTHTQKNPLIRKEQTALVSSCLKDLDSQLLLSVTENKNEVGEGKESCNASHAVLPPPPRPLASD